MDVIDAVRTSLIKCPEQIHHNNGYPESQSLRIFAFMC